MFPAFFYIFSFIKITTINRYKNDNMDLPWTFFTKNFRSRPLADDLSLRELHMRRKGVCPFEHDKNGFNGIRINFIYYVVAFNNWTS